MIVPHFSLLGSGPTVLMLHGAEGGHLSFAPQLETFASAGYRAVAWDMPGYGSSAPIEPYTFKGLAQSCIALIETLQQKTQAPLMLLGHSMGAMVALEVALRKPALLSRLVLSNFAPVYTIDSNSLFTSINSHFQGVTHTSMSEYAQWLLPQLVGSGHLPEGIALASHCMSQVPHATYRRAHEAQRSFDRSSDLHRITCPTLLITGEQDKLAAPAQLHETAALMLASPVKDIVALKGIGHYAHLEAPDEFDTAVLNWLTLVKHASDAFHSDLTGQLNTPKTASSSSLLH
jgi:3-oxoadipate enol-lactonase